MQIRKYEFYGVDFKLELLLGILCGFFILILLILIEYIQYNFFYRAAILPVRIGNIIFSLSTMSILLNFLGKKYRSKWIVTVAEEQINIQYKRYSQSLSFNQIEKIILNGGNGMRYFTIQLPNKKVKMRLGTSFLTPFSQQQDIDILDSLIKYIQPYLDKYFIKKDRTVSLSPPGTIKLTYTRKK